MARRAGLSPSRFSVVFREHFGVSPYAYFLHLRIEHAQELLRSTLMPIKAIAESCGFADVHHFTKAFRRSVHSSPGAFRLMMAKDATAALVSMERPHGHPLQSDLTNP